MWRVLLLCVLCALHAVNAQQTYVSSYNFSAFVNCANTGTAGCSYAKQTVQNSILACNSNNLLATIDNNNGVNCVCCLPSSAPPPPTVNALAVNSSNVTSLVNCNGFSSGQCQQLQAQALSQTIVCENQLALAAYLSTIYNNVTCYWGGNKDPKQTFFGTIFSTTGTALQPILNQPGEALAGQYVSPFLNQTIGYWFPYLASTNAVPNQVPFGYTGRYFYNTIQNGCGPMSGSAGPCSFHGVCNVGYSQSYCICQPGWTGQHCDVPVVDDSEGLSCDCGVQWSPLNSALLVSTIAGYTLEWASLTRPGYFPVSTIAQAQYECYSIASCDLFVYYPTSAGYQVALLGYKVCTSGTYSWHPEFTASVNCNPLTRQSVLMSQVLNNLGLQNAQGAYTISRSTGYNCPATITNSNVDGTAMNVRGTFLDIAWYYFSDPARRAEIDEYACGSQMPPIISASGFKTWLQTGSSNISSPGFQYCSIGYFNNPLCDNSVFYPCVPIGILNDGKTDLTRVVDTLTGTVYSQELMKYTTYNTTSATYLTYANTWVLNAWSHWIHVGHKKRYSPNAQCILYPTLWDPATMCSQPTSGCWYSPDGGVPCNAPLGGFCSKQVGAASGSCDCNAYDSSFGQLTGQQRFFGAACQWDGYVVGTNTQYNVPVICDGHGFVEETHGFQPFQVVTPSWYLPAPNQAHVSVDIGAAQCDCDGSGYGGTYCNVNPCGTCGSSSAQGLCNYVTLNNVTFPKCQCFQPYIGQYCQITATSLMYPPGNINAQLCSGAGLAVCVAFPGGVATYDPNCIAATTPICLCNQGYYGTYCQNQNCTSTTLVTGHGVCLPNGQSGGCYPPYTGSQYTDPVSGTLVGACATDNCAAWGGSVSGSGANATCICPYGSRTWTDSQGKVSCAPECDKYLNVTCGPDDPTASCIYTFDIAGQNAGYCNQFAGTSTKCVYSQSLGLVRTAKCGCTDNAGLGVIGQYPTLPSPSNSSQYVCLKRCKNNSTYVFVGDTCHCTDPAFTSTAPLNDCGTPYCYHNGTYNSGTGVCTCAPPWTGLRCQTSLCGDIFDTAVDGSYTYNTTLPSMGTTFYGANGWQCACNKPFGGYNNTQPTDCINPSGACGAHGLVDQTYAGGHYTSALGWCDCSVLYTTNQTKFLTNASASLWSWCDVPKCQNGGSANILNNQLCDCQVPWYSILVAGQTFSPYCTLNTCGVHGRPVSGVGCICDVSLNGIAWSNSNCTKSPCLNGGTWNSTIGCNCARGWEGAVCDIKIPCVQGTYNSTNQCACNSGWTGLYCDQLSSLIPTPTPTPTPTTPPFTRKPTPGSNSTTNSTGTGTTVVASANIWSAPFIAVLTIAIASVVVLVYFQGGNAAREGYQLLGRK